jgi:hypothetical protein
LFKGYLDAALILAELHKPCFEHHISSVCTSVLLKPGQTAEEICWLEKSITFQNGAGSDRDRKLNQSKTTVLFA